MLLLLALLSTGAVPARWLAPGAPFLTRHLAFFFVPITVGLMGFGALFRAHGVAILAVLVSSAAVGICGAGLTSEALEHRRRPAEVPT
jgi:holin-like protein